MTRVPRMELSGPKKVLIAILHYTTAQIPNRSKNRYACRS
eukprot:gene3868-96_t